VEGDEVVVDILFVWDPHTNLMVVRASGISGFWGFGRFATYDPRYGLDNEVE
jgi:hypothetical protein